MKASHLTHTRWLSHPLHTFNDHLLHLPSFFGTSNYLLWWIPGSLSPFPLLLIPLSSSAHLIFFAGVVSRAAFRVCLWFVHSTASIETGSQICFVSHAHKLRNKTKISFICFQLQVWLILNISQLFTLGWNDGLIFFFAAITCVIRCGGTWSFLHKPTMPQSK